MTPPCDFVYKGLSKYFHCTPYVENGYRIKVALIGVAIILLVVFVVKFLKKR
jgi:dolichyl-phosphate-mannose--protein O-mannosyl transferase